MTEPKVEAQHSLIHRSGVLKRISPAYASLALRIPTWESTLRRKPELLRETMSAFEALLKKGALARDLGLHTHPHVAELLEPDPFIMVRKHAGMSHSLLRMTATVMYSNDAETKFAQMQAGKRAHKAAMAARSVLALVSSK